MESEQPTSSIKDIFANNPRLAIVAAILVVGFLIMSGVALTLLVRGSNEGDPTPTPFADTDPAAAAQPIVVGISNTERISVTVDVPVTLQIGTQSFAVHAQTIQADRVWTPTFESDDSVVWVYGTVINYVLGLSGTDDNRSILEQMSPGDLLTLTTRNGVRYNFAFSSRDRILVGNPEVYAQHTPGLTLILVGANGEERLVVNGRYLDEESTNAGPGQGNVIELGETAQLDDIQLTVTGAAYVLDRPEAQPGYAFYLIDYQAQNIGLSALDTSRLKLTLLDQSGNQYAINPSANQLGNHPALGGFLNAGQTALATAGYQIPLGLNSTSVHWIVTREDTGGQLQVAIPFGGGVRAAQDAQITLNQAVIPPDLTSLILNGQISNLGTQPIVISEADISMKTDDGAAYLLLSINPAFPWTVSPGQAIQYTVTYQRPLTANAAVFTILNQPFQLSNLR